MASVPGQPSRLTDEHLRVAADAFRACGLSVSAAARSLGLRRSTMQHRLRRALDAGFITEEELSEPNPLKAEDYMSAARRKNQVYERKKRRGNWLKPSLIHMPDEPCILVLMGDPHLDNDGTDFALFERSWLDMGPGVYGLCVGDWFDNWLPVLAHKYADTSVTPHEAWVLFSGLMQARGEFLLAACSGNHDDWTRGIDPISEIMRQFGVRYRTGAIRLALMFGERVIRISMRHKWQGRSQFGAAHGLVRGTRDNGGIWDHLLIGGHIHQDDDRKVVRAVDGFIAQLCQLSAFKIFDDYADTQGFVPNRMSPVRYVVIDPRKADDDPRVVTVFWSLDAAQAYRGSL